MKATIVFDGVCGFCNACVGFVIRRDPAGYFSFVSSESTLGRQWRAVAGDPSPDSIILIEDNVAYLKSDAVLRIGRRLARPWRWVWWFRRMPPSLRDALYDEFARHRSRFGTAPTCQLPTPDQRQRILLTDNP